MEKDSNMNSEDNLKKMLNLQNKIEEKMKFLEENAEELTEKQIEDLMNAALLFEENLFPEIEQIKNEMEEKKQEIIRKAQESNENQI